MREPRKHDRNSQAGNQSNRNWSKEGLYSRPSSSHIYPFLSKLVEKGLLEERKEGRKKVYSLTEDGESFASEKVESFGEVIEASLLDQVEECENCGCEIYSGGYREEGKVFCCEHCASSA
ncbi:MAG: PadR family transcriptional regulator [Candidatus Nanohalobium sp.]